MDDNGYPEEHELEKIKTWPHENGYAGLLDYCISIWKFEGWAAKKRSGKYRFATGGWSGNESIIESLTENHIFWMTCWESSHRGGLYWFVLPKTKKEKKP